MPGKNEIEPPAGIAAIRNNRSHHRTLNLEPYPP
jgi:hypothetical protein